MLSFPVKGPCRSIGRNKLSFFNIDVDMKQMGSIIMRLVLYN